MKPAVRSEKNRIVSQLIYELPFWLSLLFWSLMPSTKTPWFEIESIRFRSKDIVLIAVAIFYLLLSVLKNRPINAFSKSWHYHLPILTTILLLYAVISVDWNGKDTLNQVAMIYTLVLIASGFLLGYNLIAQNSPQSVRSFLWRITVYLAFLGLLYSAESFFSLGLRSELTNEWTDFGIQRVRGPLFAASTGYFILLPALAFSIQEIIQRPTQLFFKLTIVVSLFLTIFSLGSRAGFLILGIFFILLICFMKNKKQVAVIVLLMIVVSTTSTILVFSKANSERLKSLEASGRAETHLTSFKIIQRRNIIPSIFGSGYGSYWSWYLLDSQEKGVRGTSQYSTRVAPLGNLLYHPHSTFLLLIVELGMFGFIYFLYLWTVLACLLFRNLQNVPFPILTCGVVASGFSMFFDFFIFREVLITLIWCIFLFGALALNSDVHRFKPPN